MSRDAEALLKCLYETSPNSGDFISIGVLAQAMGWNLVRMQRAMDELVDRGLALGVPLKNAIARP